MLLQFRYSLHFATSFITFSALVVYPFPAFLVTLFKSHMRIHPSVTHYVYLENILYLLLLSLDG